jgi:hypothetical protein
MYKHEIETDIQDGKQVRRAGWPAGHHISKVASTNIEPNEEEREAAGLDEDAEVTTGDIFIYTAGKKQAIYGYQMSNEDKVCQDWELVIEKKK